MGERPKFGSKLRKAREGDGLSLREVGRRSGINSGHLSLIERGKVKCPSIPTLARLAQAYGLPLSVVHEWAGLGRKDPLSANARRVLGLLGDEFTDAEVEAVAGVLKVIRRG